MKQVFKHTIICVASICLFFSCNKASKQENVTDNDSAGVVANKKAKVKAERAEKFRTEDDKILGKTKFFMSKEEWEKNIDEHFSEFINPDKSIGAPYYKVGNYGFFTSYPEFYNDSLYKVQIRGTFAYSNDYANKIPADYKAAMALLTQKFGEPDESITLPKFHQTPTNGFIPLAAWEIGHRMISIVLNCDNAKYAIDLFIYRKDLAERKDKEERGKAEQKTAADAKRI